MARLTEKLPDAEADRRALAHLAWPVPAAPRTPAEVARAVWPTAKWRGPAGAGASGAHVLRRLAQRGLVRRVRSDAGDGAYLLTEAGLAQYKATKAA